MNTTLPTRRSVLEIPEFNRFAVGFDRMFDELAETTRTLTKSGNYPPYNIVKNSETSYSIEVAVAGFGENEIRVSVENNTLTILGNKVQSESEMVPEYVYQGISGRAFTRQFTLAEYVRVVDAKVSNGILTVNLEKVIPEELKPRNIEVSFVK